MPAVEKGQDLHDWPGFVVFAAVLGAIGGGGLWVVHRVRGKLPSRVI